jgi:hypothetical protein
MGWVGTLFVFSAESTSPSLLWLGRSNFAAALLVAPAVLTFVQELVSKPVQRMVLLWLSCLVGGLLCLATGLIDRAETIVGGLHVTTYGPLFGVYIVAVVWLLLLALRTAFWPDRDLVARKRAQLRLVGIGILATALISITTNAVLPALFSNFRLINLGTLSTILFLVAIAYAVFFQGLFNVSVMLRTTAVYAVLIGFALELYQVTVEFLAHMLPLGDPVQQRVAAASIVFIVNALSHEPLKKVLERVTNHLATGKKRSAR